MERNRLLLVSNRLPVTASVTGDGVELAPSSGGLVSGLRPHHERSDALWFGWPGEVPDARRSAIHAALTGQRMVAVHLRPEEVDGYYHGFANGVVWPLFHYSIDRVPVDTAGWPEYRAANEAFAAEVAAEYRPGDTIWVHDYHLMLLPGLLRQRLPDARIGFFLHIPFPSSEVFRVLPWRREILHGLLGADLIGFHTFSYMRHFLTSLLHVEGVEADVDRVRVGGREVRVGAFPMGIDAGSLAALAADPQVRARVAEIRQEAGGRRIVLGVDRLDYTKGIPRRLAAVGQLLERDPTLRDGMRYIQIAVPSRGDVESYRCFRREVEETVGRMNGTYGTLRSLPIHYVHQSVALEELVALYCAADVLLVTPLRDGMNLVGKEFAASRIDDDGVLILSEFAGAASELQGAVTVNPYDVHSLADTLARALNMPIDERRARMRSLRRRVCSHDVFVWTEDFLRHLSGGRQPRQAVCRPPELPVSSALAEARRTNHLRLLLDYDGTLVPIARSPELAAPDDGLLALLEQLATTPGLEIDIVSGRPGDALERWLGHLPIALWAEHGFWRRRSPRAAWEPAVPFAGAWMEKLKPILDQFTAATPGAQLEVKTASMAWHYRGVPRDFGNRQAHELRLLLGDLLSNQPVEVLEGKKVIEVRMRGVSKAMIAQRIQAEDHKGVTLVAIGDDRTDEDLFGALPASAITIAVGRPAAGARFHVDDPRAVRHLLASLIDDADAPASRFERQAASA
ncbi:MAG TPA: bifunctional alpha,alpha-trehalose-phosphate synthase (UDP-forming)/trehalose-phosphatase [Vicinamibacterales bacterium]|nr:bifunctional alpha,alpha-trehalose-phosphate synthase (UDP-forming)/trehalose-phosphatase [Vicinamibacterales bacterium]